MKKLVIEHYPAWKLPEELRGDIPLDALVTVTVEEETTERQQSPVNEEKPDE